MHDTVSLTTAARYRQSHCEALAASQGKVGTAAVSELRIGDRVVVHGEIVAVAGFSPMSVVPRLVYLDDPETGERLDVALLEEIEKAKRAQGA
ncbi:MAG: hypothetical protein ACRDL2_02725 [Gaiellaceae bacterium]